MPEPNSFFNPYKQQAEAIRNRQRGSVPMPPPMKPGEVMPTAQDFGPEPTNVMEMLVTMEVVKQVQGLPKQIQSFIKVTQVKAYALNILPPLYVTSAKGWDRYWEKGKGELHGKVQMAVRQGIAAVQRDPLRETSALPHERTPITEAALKQIQRLLGDSSLTWYNVVPAIKRALRYSQSQGTAQRPAAQPNAQVNHGETVIQENQSDQDPPSENFDWDAHPLHQRGW